jgi:outer membrane protein assembly factor BamE
MRYFLIVLSLLLAGCGSTIPTIKPFKMDIQQGNVVTSKMLLQLRPGMTKSQVKFIMGSPLIVDSFHKDRWDYFYQLRQAGKIVEQRRVILDFDKDLLTKVRGDVVPQGTAGAATGNESSVAKTITVEPKPKQEKSWSEKLKFWKSDEPAKENEKLPAAREKTDAPEANIQAPAGDAPASSADAPAGEAPTTEVPSVLAVPIGGVLAPDAPAVDVPATDVPVVEAPKLDAPATSAPAVEAPVITAPVIEAPVTEAAPAEKVKPVETPQLIEAPQVEAPQADEPKAPVPMPAAKAGEPLIFRMDRNLDLNNLQAPIEAAPEAEIKSDATSNKTVAKPKKIEAPLPPEEAPGYFERMLEKIGF